MAKKVFPPTILIERCNQCSKLEAMACPTEDSWERAENWYCSGHEDVPKIAGYVEWNDKVPVPKWCPMRVERKKE